MLVVVVEVGGGGGRWEVVPAFRSFFCGVAMDDHGQVID